jgi:hypothetical protein
MLASLASAAPSGAVAPEASRAAGSQASGEGGPSVSAEAGAPAAPAEVDFSDGVIRILTERKDKDDAGPLAAALALELPRVDLYVLREFTRLGTAVVSYRPQVEACLARPDESVRAAAVKALGKFHDPAVAGRLLELLRSDPAAAVRAAAAEALGELQQPDGGPAVVEALSDPAPEVRQAAALAVAQLKWAAGGSAVAGRLEMDRDVRVRELAAYALGELGGTQWTDALAQALAKDPSSRVRLNAAEALGKVGARGALDVLVAALEDPDIHVREAVVVALGRLGDPRVVAPLEQLLGHLGTAETEALATRVWQTLMRLAADDQSALRQLAVARYRAGDRDRAREAAQRLVDRFGSVEGATDAWSGMVLLGVLACQRGNSTQAEPMLRQALSSLEWGGLAPEQVQQMGELFGVGGALKDYLQDQLVTVLATSGRGREALLALDEMAKPGAREAGAHEAGAGGQARGGGVRPGGPGGSQPQPPDADRWWGRRYEVLLQLAQSGEWPTVEFYLKGAAKAAPAYGGAYHERLDGLARQAAEALDKMSGRDLVGLWLRAADDVATSVEPRLRARGREVLAALVDALEDQDVRLRGRAAVLLRALTGQNLSFDPEGTPEERAAAVARWRGWLEHQPEPGVATSPPAAPTKPAEPAPAPAPARPGANSNK